MADEDLEGTLDELLPFVEARRLTRTLPDGQQLVWDVAHGLTAEEVDQVFLLDQVAGVLAKKLGLSLPAAPARLGPHESYLPCTHLRYQRGPRMVLCPTREWVAEIKAIRSVATTVTGRGTAVREERPADEDWMPARKAVDRARQEGLPITLPTALKWRQAGKPGLKTRDPTLPGRHRWEVEYNSLIVQCHRSGLPSGNVEPCEGSFDDGIKRAKAAARGAATDR